MPWQNKKKNYRGPHNMHGAAQTVANRKQQWDFFYESDGWTENKS